MLPSRITTLWTDSFYSLSNEQYQYFVLDSTAFALLYDAQEGVHSMQNVIISVLLLYLWSPQHHYKIEVVDGGRTQLLSNNKLRAVSATKFQLLVSQT